MNLFTKSKNENSTGAKQPAPEAKEKAAQNQKLLSDTEEKAWWEKMADTVAGDNKLIRILLNPLVIIAAVVTAGYWFLKLKEESTRLKQENEKLKKELAAWEEDYRKLKKKHKKLKQLEVSKSENESNIKSLGFVPQQALPMQTATNKPYQTAYLD